MEDVFQMQCFINRKKIYLHVLVFDLLTGGDAVGDVEVDELWR